MPNLDMTGRNENDDPSRSRTVNLIGSDRISTELHNIDEEANARLPEPLDLDYDHNDLQNVSLHYFGSDHDTYALKGVPVIFYNTGRHAENGALRDYSLRSTTAGSTPLALHGPALAPRCDGWTPTRGGF
jgi:hypothetical protein